jgi:NADPH2 dehydrogenase
MGRCARHISYYGARARGIGLVIVEHSYVDRGGRFTATQLGVHDDRLVPGLKRLADIIHSSGASAAIQINHSGGKCVRAVCEVQPVAPSNVRFWKETPRPLEVPEIGQLVTKFGDGAERVIEAGFDAVEIHAAHGWLLNQFHSPISNKRNDQYGGSLENRFRFTMEVVREVRRRVGPGYPVLYRFGADDFTEGGLTLDESKKMAPGIVGAGVDMLDVSSGMCGIYPPGEQRPGFLIPLAEEMRKICSVPVIGVGGIRTAELADRIVRKGKVDLVAVGRALMGDPDWGVKAMDAFGKETRE